MPLIQKIDVTNGVFWVEVPEAGLYLVCGCPSDTVKHLKKAGLIQRRDKDGYICETGPNAILLSDAMIQNGQLSNLTEFPVLQMLYLQGMNIPGHPNYGKSKPMLAGIRDHIESQIRYIYRGNYGLTSYDEVLSTGIGEEMADKIFEIKMQFAYGKITPPDELIDQCVVGKDEVELLNEVYIQRVAFNCYRISYRDEQIEVDLNLGTDEHYVAPFDLPYKPSTDEYFSVVHAGEGNGWDVDRPCMSSVVAHKGKNYLIDAGPNILNNLEHLGISVSEIEGIFQSHVHDDHFAGLTELIKADKKFKYYTTPLVRKTAEKKLSALMNIPESAFYLMFDCVDLRLNEWNTVDGMKVKPVFSPHPVETNVFYFSASNGREEKVYAHLSDTVSFGVFNDMIEKSDSSNLSAQDLRDLKKEYLWKVDLKKVDVGEGLIHGQHQDYLGDRSTRIVYAHTDEFNSNAPREDHFGVVEVLIRDGTFNFEKVRALYFLGYYFGKNNKQGLESLYSGDVRHHTPGETIAARRGREDEMIYLVLSGVVHASGETGSCDIPAGTFIGYSNKYFDHSHIEKYTAVSHVRVLKMDVHRVDDYLMQHASAFLVQEHLSRLHILEQHPLFSGGVSRAVLNRLCAVTQSIPVGKSVSYSADELNALYIVVQGAAVLHRSGKELMRIGSGDHFGALSLLERATDSYEVMVPKGSDVLRIDSQHIRKIPSVLWKVLESNEKRQRICALSSEN